jgi:hypothetical protein
MGPALRRFRKKCLFASARLMTRHFSTDRVAIKSILDREPGLRRFARRWMTHILSAEQKLRRVTESQRILTLLANLAEKNFLGSLWEMSPGSPTKSNPTRC